MSAIDIKYNGKWEHIVIADEWNKLSLDALLFIGQYWNEWKDIAKFWEGKVLKGDILLKAKVAVFLKLIVGDDSTSSSSKKKNKEKLIAVNALPNDDQWQLAQLTNFIFKENKLTKCPLPSVIVGDGGGKFVGENTNKGRRTYYAPEDELGNITGFEWAFADKCYLDYHNTNDEKYLNLLVATLYRPKAEDAEKTGELRVKFNHRLIETYEKDLKLLKYAEKQLILLWFMGCRNYIVKQNKMIFSEKNTANAGEKGWIHVIMELSGNKFGNVTETGETDLFLLFLELRALKEKSDQVSNKRIPVEEFLD